MWLITLLKGSYGVLASYLWKARNGGPYNDEMKKKRTEGDLRSVRDEITD
jgi:hypothetical protein